MIKIAPSILAADPLNLERDVRRAEEAGADWLHIDVMDAHFVPNLAYGPEVVKHLRKTVRMPLDVHLMMDHPSVLLDAFLDAGADVVTIHAEIDEPVPELLKYIRERGAKAGLALKPATGLEGVTAWMAQADLMLAMTVEPGFGGQHLEPEVIAKIRQIRDSGYAGYIEADGGIREDNLQTLIDNGLTVAVMGTALFGHPEMKAEIRRLHKMEGVPCRDA